MNGVYVEQSATRLKRLFASKAAVAALAFGMAYGAPAFAQQPRDSLGSQNASLAETVQQQAEPKLTTSWKITADPVLPLGAIIGFGLLYGAFCVPPLRRRTKGSFLRVAAGATLVTLMVNPEIAKEERELLSTEVAIVVDKSASQSLDGRDLMTGAAYAELVKLKPQPLAA